MYRLVGTEPGQPETDMGTAHSAISGVHNGELVGGAHLLAFDLLSLNERPQPGNT
jgi:hypothetical protein